MMIIIIIIIDFNITNVNVTNTISVNKGGYVSASKLRDALSGVGMQIGGVRVRVLYIY
jgi:hypothetical protein